MEGKKVLVTISNGKVFSAGYNLKELMKPSVSNISYGILGQTLTQKVLNLNMPTLAVVNGHAIAAGLWLALCHDRIIMVNDEKTYMLLNELQNGITFSSSDARLPMELLSPTTGRQLLMGYKFYSKDAYDERIVRGLFSS